jgi:hypothetical protein
MLKKKIINTINTLKISNNYNNLFNPMQKLLLCLLESGITYIIKIRTLQNDLTIFKTTSKLLRCWSCSRRLR